MPSSAGRLAWCLAVLSVPAALSAQPAAQPQGKLVQDVWETAYLDGCRVGYTRLTVEELSSPAAGKILRARRELNLTVRRGPDLARIDAVTGTDETPDGTVVGVFMQQSLASQVQQVLRGVVRGPQLEVTAEGAQGNFKKTIPWNPKTVGALGEENLLRNRKPKPGDSFDYLFYEPTINATVTVRVKAERFEDVAVGTEKVKLLRLASVPDEIANMQLPLETIWADPATFEVRRSATAIPGMGFLVVERGTRDLASRPVNPAQLPDLLERQSIKLAQRVANAHQLSSITYRITLTDDKDPAATFPQDDRQAVRNVRGNTFDLAVTARKAPPPVTAAAATDPGKEYTESNYFITSDDPRVKQHAARAVGKATDPWEKAKAVEQWVNRNMKVLNFSEAMAPAFRVAETLEGDCTEFSMLAAAMCKAAGVPARTAIGLVYVDAPAPRQPLLGFHMWTEVFVRGKWVAIDATLGQGGIGPGHLKITDASWHDTRSMTPLLPLMRVMIARPKVEIVDAR